MRGRLISRQRQRLAELSKRRQLALQIALRESRSPEEREFLGIFADLSEKGMRAVQLHDRIAKKMAEEERILEKVLSERKAFGENLEVLDKFNTGFAEIKRIFEETRDGKKELANLTLIDLNNFLIDHPLFRNTKLGQNISTYLDSENYKKLLTIITNSTSEGKTSDVIKFSIGTGKSKISFYFSVSATPIKDKTGRIERIILGMHDATKLVKKINQIEETLTRLEYAEIVAKSIGVIAHDLKRPLATMKLYIDSLKADVSMLVNEEAFQELMGDADTIDRLADEELAEIEKLLNLRTSSGAFRLEEKNLPVFLKGAIQTVKDQINSARIGWKFNFEGTINTIEQISEEQNIHLVARIDNPSFIIALNNIVRNAIEAIQEKREEMKARGREFRSPLIEFFLSFNPQKKYPFEIKIVDNGIGISARDEKKLNERLSGESSDRYTTKMHGTGWGLGDIGDAIRKHNGVVGVRGIISEDERENLGTEVVIHLPAYEEKRERRGRNR